MTTQEKAKKERVEEFEQISAEEQQAILENMILNPT